MYLGLRRAAFYVSRIADSFTPQFAQLVVRAKSVRLNALSEPSVAMPAQSAGVPLHACSLSMAGKVVLLLVQLNVFLKL